MTPGAVETTPAAAGVLRVLLVNPPGETAQTREGRCTQSSGFWRTTWPPLSLASIGGLLRHAGADVRIVDCANVSMGLPKFLALAASFRPDVAVWPVGNVSPDADLGLGAALRKILPDVRTVVFGTLAGALPEACLERQPEIDAVLMREPEASVVEVVQALHSGRGVEGIAGAWSRGQRAAEGEAGLWRGLDTMPFPAWDLVGPRRYRLPLSGRPFLMAAPSRGCLYRCSFCTATAYYGKTVRKRSPENFVDELERNLTEYGVRDFLFWADTFTIDRQQVLGICEEMLRRNLRLRWTCNSRADSIDAELLGMMTRAGCWFVSFGIESADPKILASLGKRLDLERVHQAVCMVNDAGAQSSGHFVLGLPGETRETAQTTIGLACSLPLHWAQFYAAAPWPGARLFDHALANGLMTLDDVWAGISQEHARISLCELTPDEINAFLSRANRLFLRRGRTVGAALSQLRPAGLKNLLTGWVK
jgi:radical SAM superfamily enzyme YgiQ (UPF0313 family)